MDPNVVARRKLRQVMHRMSTMAQVQASVRLRELPKLELFPRQVRP